MSFMISRETDNVRSMAEVEGAFRAITARGDKPYVTKDELLQVLAAHCSTSLLYYCITMQQALPPEQAEYCVKRMKAYRDSTGAEIRGAYDYTEFAQRLF